MAAHLISVVVPLYNEQQNLLELHRRLSKSLAELTFDYELVLVNDGSTDATTELLNHLAKGDEHVVAVHLSRNFGHQPAVSAGMELAGGEAVIVMDGDLQDPPEVLGQFVDRWREGYEVVYAVRTKRKEGWLKRAGYFLFYRTMRSISDMHMPVDSGDFCLMDRRVVDVLNALPEKSRFVRGLRAFVGFQQTGLCYERAEREAGEPKYGLRALMRLALEGLLSFSSLPLTLITVCGVVLTLVSFLTGGMVVVRACVSGTFPEGWLCATIVGLFLASLQLLSLGIVGQYVQRIFQEVKGRPTFLVREVVRQNELLAVNKKSQLAA